MQTSLLSANTHFNPMMMARVELAEDIRAFPEYDRHHPRPVWSLPETAMDSKAKKIPTESDDRDDYSSGSERAEDDLSGADFSGVASGSEDRACEGSTTTTAVVITTPLFTSTASFGEHVVLVAAEAANTDIGFQLQNDEAEDIKTLGDGLKTIEDELLKMSLTESDSVPLNVARGPNGGRASKTGTLNENHLLGAGYQRQEPTESWDGGCYEDQPTKFYKPNDQPVPNNSNGRNDFYSSLPAVYSTASLPPMQSQLQHSEYDLPTGYSFPILFEGNAQYLGTCQGAAPTYQPQSLPCSLPVWASGFPPRNHYSSLGNQPEICPTVQQIIRSSPTKSNFPSENVSTTFFQYPSPNIDNGIYQTSYLDRMNNCVQYTAARPSMPVHQHQLVSNVQTIPHVPLDQGDIRFSDGASPISTVSSEPVTTCSSSASDLEMVLEWLGEQAETQSQPHSLQTTIPAVTNHCPSSSPTQCVAPWNDLSLPSVTFSLVEPSYSDILSLSLPGQCLPPCNEFAHTLNLAASSYTDSHFDSSGTPAASLYRQIPASSSGSLTAASSSSNLCPSPTSVRSAASPPNVQFSTAASPSPIGSSVLFSVIDASPPSRVAGVDAGDGGGLHSSRSSDCLRTSNSVLSLSDLGSVGNSPSSVFESDATIPGGDEPDDGDKMAQVAEAEAVAESLQELALISQDPQGDTPLHMAMIDDKWYLAESILKRLIKDNLVKEVINVRNKLQQTPLCLAVICNKPEIVETLIEHGANVNVHIKASDDYLGPKFCHPLHLASSRGHLWKQTLKKLLRADNIDLDIFNSDGKSALHCAIEGHGRQFKDVTIDCKDTLRMLAERGANLNQPDCGHEKTPLHYAIERRDVELVSRLLVLANTFSLDRSSVAKMLEARTGNGNTALHLAASVDMNTVEHKKLIQQLMSKGADPSSKNSDGFLPRELTKNRAIVELLKGRTASGRSPNAEKKRSS